MRDPIDRAALASYRSLQARPSVGAERSYWLREALADEQTEPCPELSESVKADFVILGGGYTGLWTAYFLTELAPGAKVVVLEADICGGGTSGRNGGFLTGWWDELASMTELYGQAKAIAACRALGSAIRAIGEWCTTQEVDAWYKHAGYLTVATSETHERRLKAGATVAERAGVADEYRLLTEAEVRARCNSPRFRRGILMPDGATVQPARLARGLRRVVLGRGVKIFENTHVEKWDVERGVVRVSARSGTVEAGRAVVALNAWAARVKPFHRLVVAWSSYIALTAPIPERLEELHWTKGECITDTRGSIHYFRTTPDGRIALGGGGGEARSGHRIGPVFTTDEEAVRRAVFALWDLFPSLRNVTIESAWGGPIDVSWNHLPFFGTLPSGKIHFGLGYTGNGVGPSYLGGRALTALALDREDEFTRLPMVDSEPKRFPIEPFRSVGARLIRNALLNKDDAEERDEQVGVAANFIAGLPRRMGFHLGA